MDSMTTASTALFLTLNLLLFSIATSTYGTSPSVPVPTTPALPVPTPYPTVPTLPNPSIPSLPNPPVGYPGLGVTCPIDTLKLNVCANVLSGLLNIVIGGGVAKEPCCSLIAGLVDLDAAVCLCTAIKANVLGINLNIPISLSLLLNDCGKNLPAGFLCY